MSSVLPLYETFCQKKKNQDKLLESFYGLIPQSCELLNCEDFRSANLMMHIPDHLVGFYNISHLRHTEKATSKPVKSTTQIDPAERGPVVYQWLCCV